MSQSPSILRTVLLLGAACVAAIACSGVTRIDDDSPSAGTGGVSSGGSKSSGGAKSTASGGGTSVGGSTSRGGSGSGGSISIGNGGSCNTDSDGDGISDESENRSDTYPRDTDWDKTPDYLDADSDADGIPDKIEGLNVRSCDAPGDTDGDGVPDFRDLDSDGEGLADANEIAGGFDPRKKDTDGDGCDDLAESLFHECDPEHNVVAHSECFHDLAKGALTLTVSATPARTFDKLTLHVFNASNAAATDMSVQAVSITPPGSATLTGPSVLNAASGSKIVFSFNLTEAGWNAKSTMYEFRLLDSANNVMDTGKVWVEFKQCPIIK